MASDNVALVRRFIDEVWNKGHFAVCDEVLASKHEAHDPLLGDTEGAEITKNNIKMFRAAFPDLAQTNDDIGASGDRVYVRWTITGTHKGTLMGVPPTNRRGMVHGMSIHRLENGKIAETHYAWNVYDLIEQIGLVPPLKQLLSKGGARSTANV